MSLKSSPNSLGSNVASPRTFGVTGGIGSGKSFICRSIEAAGFPVFYCDAEAKRIIRTNAKVKNSLILLVGDNVYAPDGTLCKAVLAEYICRSKQHAARVDAIVHPAVGKAFAEWTAEQTAPILFMECALLFESGFDKLVDRSILVSAPEEERIARVMERDGVSHEKVKEWMALQMPEEEKAGRADYIIYNNYARAHEASLRQLLEDITKI